MFVFIKRDPAGSPLSDPVTEGRARCPGDIAGRGKVTTYPGGGSNPFAIVAGPGKAMWFTAGSSTIGRITTR